MLKKFCTSKIHRATITKKDLEYKGSIGIDKKLLDEADMLANEMVLVLNYSNGARFETYIIEEEENSGTIALYGPAAKLGEIGDEIIVISSALIDTKEAKDHQLKVIKVNKENRIIA
jgi:aspartate 1-decarboxylase